MHAVAFPVLDAMSEGDRRRLLDRSVARTLRPGTRLYMAGEPGGRAHLLGAGVMKLIGRSGEGSETIIGLGLPGELIGEVASLDGLQQPLDAVAASRCEVLGLDAGLLVECLRNNSEAAFALTQLMARRARWMCETALERTASEVPARLAGRLLDLADMLGTIEAGAVEMDLPLAQGDLGKLAGMCRESACKTLRRFKDAGVVDYRGRRLRILQPAALERIRCSGRIHSEPAGRSTSKR